MSSDLEKAFEFYDKVVNLKWDSEERLAVGTDHINWVMSSARAAIAKLDQLEKLRVAADELTDYYIANPYGRNEFIVTVSGGGDVDSEALRMFRALRKANYPEREI